MVLTQRKEHIELLTKYAGRLQRHSLIMDARPEKRPGQLKIKAN